MYAQIQKIKDQLSETNRVGLLFVWGFFEVKNYTNDFWIKKFTCQIIHSIWIEHIEGKEQTPCSAIFPEVQPHALMLNQEIVMTPALNSNSHQLEEQQDVNPSIQNLGLLKHVLY